MKLKAFKSGVLAGFKHKAKTLLTIWGDDENNVNNHKVAGQACLTPTG